MRVGLAISTYLPRGAPAMCRRRLPTTLDYLLASRYAGPIYIIDDGSNDAEHLAYLAALESRNYQIQVILRPTNGGIARTKNTCLRVLSEAEVDIGFLADDDLEFLPDWLGAYVAAHEQTGIHHFSWACDLNPNGPCDQVEHVINGRRVVSTNYLTGPFLSFTPKVLQLVGGFKILPAKWGWEHVNWTNRIVRAGLAPFLADIADSNRYLRLHQYCAVSVISAETRKQDWAQNEGPAADLSQIYYPLVD